MCFFYNEGHLSRTNRWRKLFQEQFGTTVYNKEYKVFSIFSIEYEKFIGVCFPKLSKQLNILNVIISIVIEQDLPAKLETLYGCILSWYFGFLTEFKRSIYKLVSGAHQQVRV